MLYCESLRFLINKLCYIIGIQKFTVLRILIDIPICVKPENTFLGIWKDTDDTAGSLPIHNGVNLYPEMTSN